jgi:hypothetical protein
MIYRHITLSKKKPKGKSMRYSKRSMILNIVCLIIITSFFISEILGDINLGYASFDPDKILDNRGFAYGTKDWIKEAGSWSVSSNEKPDGDPHDTQSLYVSSGYEGYVEFYQIIDTVDLYQIKGKPINFGIWFKSWDDAAQVSIKYQDYYHSWYTKTSNWVYALDEMGDEAWTFVSITQYIPNEVLHVQVMVTIDDLITQFQQGYMEDYVQSLVDEAEINIIDESISQNDKGRGVLQTNIYKVSTLNYAELIVEISDHSYSYSSNYYIIERLEIRVELVPTSQSGTIDVIQATQTNNANLQVKPDESKYDSYANGPSNFYTSVTWDFPPIITDAIAHNYISWHYFIGPTNVRLKIIGNIGWGSYRWFWYLKPFFGGWVYFPNIGTTTIIDYINA